MAVETLLAALVLYVPQGGAALDTVVRGFQHVINYSNAGIEFVFGPQIVPSLGVTIAFNVLPVIIFFAALMSLLYYLKIMPLFVSVVGGWLHRLLGTSEAESISAASNIFVGHTDAPLVVRPYLARMTESELFAVMTGGCATIAGGVMMAYATMGVELKYLITASFMAAPGGLLMAKIVLPETGVPAGAEELPPVAEEDQPVNVFEAIGNGAMTGLKVAVSVGGVMVNPGDIVVASIHWGGNWGYAIPDEHRRFAQRLIDVAGIDVIHGHSSHHPKGVEVYRDKLILYGCGDFVNDYEGIHGYDEFRGDLALVYLPEVDARTGHLTGLEMVPLQMRQFSLHHASDQDARWLADTLQREAAALNTGLQRRDDNVMVLGGPRRP